MVTKEEARAKLGAAERACNKVHAAWAEANVALGGGVSVNIYGIYRDPSELRNKLQSAQAHIANALRLLAEVDWPTDAEYDLL